MTTLIISQAFPEWPIAKHFGIYVRWPDVTLIAPQIAPLVISTSNIDFSFCLAVGDWRIYFFLSFGIS